MSRTGKIAKLPPALQEQLNQQLERGVPGRALVACLNADPAVQAVLREFFEGAPVNEQNLSAWRRGGFVDWQTRRQFFDQVREVAADAGEFEEAAAKMADHASRLLSAHYALAISRLPSPGAVSESTGPCPYAALSARLKPLASISRTVNALRRGDHEAARLKLQTARQAHASVALNHSATAPPPQTLPAERESQCQSSQIKVPQPPPAQTTPFTRPQKPTPKSSPLHLTFPTSSLFTQVA